MKLLVFANFLPVFADKVAEDMVSKFNRVFCRTIFIPAYDIFNVAPLSAVVNDFVDEIPVCFIRILLASRFSWFCYMFVFVTCLLCFVRCFVTTRFGLGGLRMRYAVNGECIRYALLFYGNGVGLHF